MKKHFLFIVLICAMFSFCSCSPEADPADMLSDFILLYGAEGTIYSSDARLSEEGFISDELFEKIFVFSGERPNSFAIFLNSHSHKGSECGVFVCRDDEEKERVIEMCKGRATLVSSDASYLLICSGNTVFYSTMSDCKNVERLWNRIIVSYS